VCALPERRAPHPQRPGLHAGVQQGGVLGVPAPHARIYPAEVATGLAQRIAAAQEDSPQLHRFFLLTAVELSQSSFKQLP